MKNTWPFHLNAGTALPFAVIILIRALLISLAVNGTSFAANAEADIGQLRQLLQLVEYIAVDYPEAIENGSVINEEEYQEMIEFSSILVDKSAAMQGESDQFESILQHAISLQKAIEVKESVTNIRESSTEIQSALSKLIPQSSLPERLLSKNTVTTLFQENCTTCHGTTGQGDGPLAAQLEPSPTDFTDRDRAQNRSILGLYESISEGIDETSMPAFRALDEEERWSLAFYVGSLAYKSEKYPDFNTLTLSMAQIAFNTPAHLASELPADQQQEAERIRANPELLFSSEQNPLSLARVRLEKAHQAYLRNDLESAHTLTVSAYLDGFELVENSLDARDPELRRSIETSMMQLRQQVKQPPPSEEFESALEATLRQLDHAEGLLSDASLSNAALFSASLVILLREGLEALLVVIALITVLIKTERRDAVKYVHMGWLFAIAAGVATWVVAQTLISISGASREVMEGVAALLAAVVLFYVGIWMHSKTHAAHWQAYIQQHVNSHLKSGTLWGLAALAFVAVYREVFETVLFYQALLTQAEMTQHTAILGGFVSGVAILALVAWVLTKYAVRLPVAMFFAVTTYLLLALSFVLMGKSISALQEAAIIGITPFPMVFEIEWIGVKSTWEGLLAQVSILALFLVFSIRTKLKNEELQPEE